jgi:hypothetical protein
VAMTDTDLARIRDEVGDDPTDVVLDDWFDELGNWVPVAIRVLKRRRANATAGGQQTKSFSLDGVLSVSMSTADLTNLNLQITRLETLWAGEPGMPPGVTTARITRTDRMLR